LIHFAIGDDHMPKQLYHAYGYVKKAAAQVNAAAGRLARWRADAISAAADEMIAGKLDTEFPLFLWQTGSGTQSNMNVNEVIAGRANELATGTRGGKSPVHPNDHVNMAQSTNDAFPTAIHLAIVDRVEAHLLPALTALRETLGAKAVAFADIVKIGRTHLQDATPLTLGQEISGWGAQLDYCTAAIVAALVLVHQLALGGTAVGTGLNAHPEFAKRAAAELARLSTRRSARR
jgi:fumarate hydratase class II